MAEYADPELLIQQWLFDQLGGTVKTWCDPTLPDGWKFSAPIVHIQRGQDFGDDHLTLDAALLDIDIYGIVPDHCRALGEKIRTAMRLVLPLHTFDNGVFVTGCTTVMAPAWLPFRDPGGSNRSAISADIARRGAAYRVTFAGMIA